MKEYYILKSKRDGWVEYWRCDENDYHYFYSDKDGKWSFWGFDGVKWTPRYEEDPSLTRIETTKEDIQNMFLKLL